jgi:hypothetical protein
MAKESLYEVWARRNPRWETKFEDKLFREFTEYGGGSVESMSSKGKIFGAGYELYIYAFFIGLYSNSLRDLGSDVKSFGQPIQFWGNLESKKFRKAYPKLRDYIFTALIAKTIDLDLIALEKGEITERKAVDFMVDTMERYTNFGLYFIEDKLLNNPNYFFKNTGFLDVILDLVQKNNNGVDKDIIETL